MKKIISLVSALLILAVSAQAKIIDVTVNGRTYKAQEGYMLIRYKPGAHAKNHSQIHAMANAKVAKRFAYPEGLELVKVGTSAQMMSALSVYNQSDDILYAEPNYIWRVNAAPNDTYFKYQWALNNKGQTGGTSGADMNAMEAWGLTKGDKRVVLGIIDTGADYTHADLAGNMWVNSLEIPNNGIDDDGNGFIDDVHGINAIYMDGDPMDDNMHGTHVAGIIAARQNDRYGISGVAPNASVAACKFLNADGEGDTAGAITCLNYFLDLATRSVDPVRIVATNNSWAGGPFSQALYEAIKANQDAGILFIAAASNEGVNNDRNETYPANFFLPNVISVAATDHQDKLASFSNYGHVAVSIAAPGVDILSTLPGQDFAYLSGTSMAAPHVTGLAGLIASYDSTLPWIKIKNLILAGGEPIAAATSTTATGRRILASGINGFGSLTCANQKITTRALPRRNTIPMRVGQSLPLAILNINCASSAASVSVLARSSTRTTALVLRDDGRGTDQLAGDGIFSGVWRATARGNYQLRFPGNDIVTIQVK